VRVVQYPLDQGPYFTSIIDVLKMTMYTFPEKGGRPVKNPIPDSEKAKAEKLHQELVEAVAVNDELLMDHYLEKGELDEDEMRTGLKKSLINHDIFPLFCLSGEKDMGSGRLMGFIDNVCPRLMKCHRKLRDRRNAEMRCLGLGLHIRFKTISEPHVGELSFSKYIPGL
jgi:elongation factor G